jgi:hypothetical protein
MADARIEIESARLDASAGRASAFALRWIPALALLCLTAYLAAGAFAVTVTSAGMIRRLDENTYPESPNIYEGIRTVRTGRLYFSLSDAPYVLQPYGPLFYVITAGIAKAAHLDVDVVAIRGRMMALACFVLCGYLAFLISRRLAFSVAESTCAAAMLMAQPAFLYWDVTVRPDMLLLPAMMASLYVALHKSWDENFRYALAGVFGGLAFLIKQPGLAALLGIGAVLIFRSRYRQAIALAVGAAAPVASVFAILLWRHEPFLAQLTLMSKSAWSVSNGIGFTVHNHLFGSLVVALAIGATGFAFAIRGEEGAQTVACFAAANWLVGISSIPQLGGDYNYYLPGLAGCALLLPFVIRAFRENVRSVVVYAGVIVVLLIFLPGEIGAAAEAAHAIRTTSSPYEMTAGGGVYAGLGALHILSDRPTFALHGRDPDFLDPFSTHGLELAGNWDSTPIAENVRRGDYDLVLLTCNGSKRIICSWRGVSYFSPAVVDALNQNYVVLCSNLVGSALVPRNREVSATPALLQTVLGAPCGTARRGQAPGLTIDAAAR